MQLNCPTCAAEIHAKEVECFYFVKVVAECKKCSNYFWGYGMDYSEAVEEALDEIKLYKKSLIKKSRDTPRRVSTANKTKGVTKIK